MRRSGQSAEEMAATREWREAQVERIAQGKGKTSPVRRDEEEDDGSL